MDSIHKETSSRSSEMPKRWTRASVLLILVVALFTGCKGDKVCNTPMGDASCQLDLMQYPNLIGGNGYEYIVGGYQGLAVIRISTEDYAAYERTCPHDRGRLEFSKDYGNTVLECPDCHSRFNAFADGVPLEGSQTSCSLYQYSTHYASGTLYISNW